MTSLWQPRSGCDPSCLPRLGATPTVHIGVRAARLVGLVVVLGIGAALMPVLPLLSPCRRAGVTRTLARAILRALGVRLVARGRFPDERALLVANHVSWLDIVAVLAHTPARLVAKHEVRGWPLIGALAAVAGTIFIDRSRPRTLPRTVSAVAEVLRTGGMVAVFPEGTTWCGRTAGRFRPAMFQAALDGGGVVVPVSLRFLLADGRATTVAAFLGDDTLYASLHRVVAVRGMTIAVTASPALHPGLGATRQTLARLSESAVGGMHLDTARYTPRIARPRALARADLHGRRGG